MRIVSTRLIIGSLVIAGGICLPGGTASGKGKSIPRVLILVFESDLPQDYVGLGDRLTDSLSAL